MLHPCICSEEFYKILSEREITRLCFETLSFPNTCDLIAKLKNLLPHSEVLRQCKPFTVYNCPNSQRKFAICRIGNQNSSYTHSGINRALKHNKNFNLYSLNKNMSFGKKFFEKFHPNARK